MRALVLGLAAVLAFLALATTVRTTDVLVGSVDAVRVGTATVSSCAEHGPVGRWGFGTSYECTADVRWNDGRTEQLTFPPGQLEPGEREVAVFQSNTGPGRNDSARWFLAGPLASMVLALLTLWLVVAMVLALLPGRKNRQKQEEWPVTKDDLKATPVTRRVRRLRLFAWLGLATAVAEGLASMPFFDAPRKVGVFSSPWPQLEDAWLVDLPSGVLAGFAVLVAAGIGLIAESVHKDGARLVRYGQPYLDTKKQVPSGGTSWVPTALIAALALGALVKVVVALPANAPLVVWLAGSRDALVLLTILTVTICTRQSAKDMVAQLMRRSMEPKPR
ncbi:DUF6346 domain-containing protein [Lentzea flava]|uniref:SdpI/YhfL protein family protein n=1 Tax=Lentzea flava TaxID=103732 RepID=A0ABQ2VBN8_9PSEU|nr:DUF6346 domain-containing protein [Lentzea flava]MCP2204266.1 hypothetical protein [Lentzea flava]GGU75916.1 hypothetical protein GCM10010178_79030 [Lentzea flava]